MRTEKRKMTLVELTKHNCAEAEALVAQPDPARAAILKASLEAAAKAEPGAEIEVDVPAPDPVAADLAAVHAKLDKLASAVEAFAGGVTAKAAYDAVVAKQGVAVNLAVEMLTAYVARIQGIAAQLQAGGADIDKESLWGAFRSYNVEEAVENALTVLGKAEGADAAVLAEVGSTLKAAFVAKTGADDAAKKAADEAAAKAAADKAAADAAATDEEVCKQCGAKMKKTDTVCSACGWERGTPVTTAKAHKFPPRYLPKKAK
jgi:ribosomal protein L40E